MTDIRLVNNNRDASSNTEIISCLEVILEEARQGKLNGVAVVACYKGDIGDGSYVATCHTSSMNYVDGIAGAEILKQRLVDYFL